MEKPTLLEIPVLHKRVSIIAVRKHQEEEKEAPDFTLHFPTSTELATEQVYGVNPIVTIYQAIRDQGDLIREQLELGSMELRKLYNQISTIQIRVDGVIEIGVDPPPPLTINQGGVLPDKPSSGRDIP